MKQIVLFCCIFKNTFEKISELFYYFRVMLNVEKIQLLIKQERENTHFVKNLFVENHKSDRKIVADHFVECRYPRRFGIFYLLANVRV